MVPIYEKKKYLYVHKARCISVGVLEAYIVIIISYIVMLAMHC